MSRTKSLLGRQTQSPVVTLKRYLWHLLAREGRRRRRALRTFLSNPNNTFLVSFPRTGSHWLRMMMELYLQRPQLTLTFYLHDHDDYFLYHTHDMDLSTRWRNVIYLYREPVATIYSQLRYGRESVNDRDRMRYWTDRYAQHLQKWLHDETFTVKKTVVRYECLQLALHQEFAKVTSHFEVPFDPVRFDQCVAQVSKEELKRKTAFDPQVVNLGQDYQVARKRFKQDHAEYIWQALLEDRPWLGEFFED